MYRYYGCASYAKNGQAVCTNRVTTRAEDAQRALLAGVQAEIARPETLEYIVARLSAALQAATMRDPKPIDPGLRDLLRRAGRYMSISSRARVTGGSASGSGRAHPGTRRPDARLG